MLSLCRQTDGQTDGRMDRQTTVKQYVPYLSMRRHKKKDLTCPTISKSIVFTTSHTVLKRSTEAFLLIVDNEIQPLDTSLTSNLIKSSEIQPSNIMLISNVKKSFVENPFEGCVFTLYHTIPTFNDPENEGF